MNLIDRLRASVSAFFVMPTAKDAGKSLSQKRSIDRLGFQYLGMIGKRIANDDPILTTHGTGDLALWRDIHDDDRCFSCFQQRRLAVVDRPWEVDAGGKDRKSKKAAEFIRYTVNRIGWDRICSRMLFGVWYGYAVGEAVYRVEPEGDWAGLIGLERIDVPDRAWFGYGKEGELRIVDAMGVRDDPVPERKFWHYSSGGDHDFVPYGIGLAHWLYWPVFFKRQGLPFWLRFLEKFGTPTVMAKVQGGKLDSETERAKVITVLRDLSGDSSVAVPDWMEVDLLDAARAGQGGYELLLDRMDAAITRVILSQTMTTDAGPAGLGSGQANVHMDVRDEVRRSDSDLLHESFNRSIVTWLTEFNFPGAQPPRVYRVMDEPEDLAAVAERDTAIKALGWERTDDSFLDVYGEGYERVAQPEPPKMGPDGKPNDQPQFSAEDIDAIDKLVTAMGKGGSAALVEFLAPLKGRLEGVTNPEVARVAMLDFLETMDAETLHEALAKAGFAVRAAAEAGLEDRLAP